MSRSIIRQPSAIILALLVSFGFGFILITSNQAQPPEERVVTAADMPRIKHTDSEKSLATFQQARGFTLEIVAAEPLVSDPVDACFDEHGRMYVAEMHGYPFSQEPTKLNPAGGGFKNAGIIRLLEDTNTDGTMDSSTVFVDNISWPTSVRPYNGGVFVIAPGFLYYFKDTDGDNKADIREVILSGFGRGNVQSVSNGLEWGLDNKIYFAAGRNPKTLLYRGKPLFPVGAVDLRFDPRTEEFEQVTGGLQFGHSHDAWGIRFVCSNSNHMQQVVYPQQYLSRNPYFVAQGLVRNVAKDGASAPVFRISPPEPWRIVRQKWRALDKGYRLVINKQGGYEFIPLDPNGKKGVVPTEYPIGYFTSATGITIYTGDAYPQEYHGNAFVGDVGGNLVHRKTINTDNVVYASVRADQKTEFVRSTDNWFRPVNFVNAPDGSLYVLDMYRETIEHPYSIPAEIKKFLDLRGGHDRGRIYRMVSPNMQRRPLVNLGAMSSSELVQQLGSHNGWTRETAQRLLWEQQDKSVVPALQDFLMTCENPLGRMHTLYALDGLQALTATNIMTGLSDKHPRVRAHAVKLSEPFLKQHPTLVTRLVKLAVDNSPHVRFQVAFSLGEVDSEVAVTGLAQIAMDPRTTAEIRTAMLSSCGNTADRVITQLIIAKDYLDLPVSVEMLTQFAIIIGSNPDAKPTNNLLAQLTLPGVTPNIQQTLLAGLGTGLRRRGSSLNAILSADTTPAELQQQVDQLFIRAATIAKTTSSELQRRIAAVKLLAYADSPTAIESLPALLNPQSPRELQLAAVTSLGNHDPQVTTTPLLASWRTYSPELRRSVVDVMMKNSLAIQGLL
ncbi:MAG: PVC-type heme-binding CxxCH protein, partial [Pirellulales bacterium]